MTSNHTGSTVQGATRPVPGRAPGGAAAVAGVLIALGVQLEWLLDFQQDDGTVVRPVPFILGLLTSAVGFAALVVAAHGMRHMGRKRRSVRVGSRMSTAGAGLLLAFVLAVLATGLATGSPTELSFLAFGIGMLLLSVGPVVLGLGVRHEHAQAGWALVMAGVAAFAAVAIPLDPWHDVSLVAMCLAWSATGLTLLRRIG